jgi:hypothetical protein
MLLDNPPHTVEVYVAETDRDSYENVIVRPSTTPITIRCIVSQRSTSQDPSSSRVQSEYKLMTRDERLTEMSRVVYLDRTFIASDVRRHSVTAETAHTTATLREES